MRILQQYFVFLFVAGLLASCGNEKNTEENQALEYQNEQEAEEKAFEKALALMQDMKVDDAMEILEKIAREGQQRERALCGLGACYLMQQQPTKALAEYEKALKIDPEYYNALIGVGSCCLDLKRYEQALEYFRIARQRIKDMPDAYRGLAIVFDRMNEPDSALANAKFSLEHDPDAQYDYDLQQIMKKHSK